MGNTQTQYTNIEDSSKYPLIRIDRYGFVNPDDESNIRQVLQYPDTTLKEARDIVFYELSRSDKDQTHIISSDGPLVQIRYSALWDHRVTSVISEYQDGNDHRYDSYPIKRAIHT